jgi:dimethylhistidine N-methyltransferase
MGRTIAPTRAAAAPTTAAATAALARFAAEVRGGLGRAGQRELPSKYLYDAVGSALFEAICLLPEYGLARAGRRLLRRHAAEIVARLPSPRPALVAELGSGSARATRLLLEALSSRHPTTYFPIDISGAALAQAERELGLIKSVTMVGFEREYLDGLGEVVARRRDGERLLVLFLGGTIGNFDRAAGDEFLRSIRGFLRSDDSLLLSTDLEKPVERLLVAYDDPIGVTAAFNLNLLARVNRELGGEFDLARFRHVVRYDRATRRIEMHLLSLADQTVRVAKADLTVRFEKGETIWTESSHKYAVDEIPRMAESTGYRCESQWIDDEWPFAQNLFRAV